MKDNDISKLIAQREAIDKQIEESKKAQRAEDLEKVRELCKLHGFSKTDLRGAIKERKKPVAKVEVPVAKTKKKAK